MPAPRELAHHRDARILVGHELGKRIEDEGEVHDGEDVRGSDEQSVATSTLLAFTMAVAALPGASASASADAC